MAVDKICYQYVEWHWAGVVETKHYWCKMKRRLRFFVLLSLDYNYSDFFPTTQVVSAVFILPFHLVSVLYWSFLTESATCTGTTLVNIWEDLPWRGPFPKPLPLRYYNCIHLYLFSICNRGIMFSFIQTNQYRKNYPQTKVQRTDLFEDPLKSFLRWSKTWMLLHPMLLSLFHNITTILVL